MDDAGAAASMQRCNSLRSSSSFCDEIFWEEEIEGGGAAAVVNNHEKASIGAASFGDTNDDGMSVHKYVTKIFFLMPSFLVISFHYLHSIERNSNVNAVYGKGIGK